MSKPIGHFTSYTINDGSLLESLQEKYGSTFERMTKHEKLFLISAIAAQLCDGSPGKCRDQIYVELADFLETAPPQGTKAGTRAFWEFYSHLTLHLNEGF
ncbi:hypothetical protein [Nostoc sp. CHAB 5715]|uniref:hypothetical protein n=1 Tax=Nostoc sp. CHAB 5715 TaxID=2780400 RepID=UPI001E3DE90A|nr:hypothetical protein [Nostoc sp. CHAB 5715]MCC5626181.1 hypothetical protein [Nostoc sp. CHAB 5715]